MKGGYMGLSKLETCIEILQTLGQQGLIQLTAIQVETDVNADYLKEHLTFLVAKGLVEQRSSRNQTVYTNTKHGRTVLKYFREHQERNRVDQCQHEITSDSMIPSKNPQKDL